MVDEVGDQVWGDAGTGPQVVFGRVEPDAAQLLGAESAAVEDETDLAQWPAGTRQAVVRQQQAWLAPAEFESGFLGRFAACGLQGVFTGVGVAAGRSMRVRCFLAGESQEPTREWFTDSYEYGGFAAYRARGKQSVVAAMCPIDR